MIISQHILLLIWSFLVAWTQCFNISPEPNIILRFPNNSFQDSSSWFGYSINLRKGSVLIGAPKDNSSFAKTKVIENGGIYKCNITITPPKCEKLDMPETSNADITRHYQRLGWSIDADTNEKNSQFIACAHKYSSAIRNGDLDMDGACYYTQSFPKNIKIIKPFGNSKRHDVTDVNVLTGFSVKISDDGENIIAGAPGLQKGDGGYFMKAKDNWNKNPYKYDGHDFSMGFSVNIGKFSSSNQFVASVPKENYLKGSASIFSATGSFVSDRFKGEQNGEYYGYNIVIDDFNGDSRLDLLISSPYYSYDGLHEHGRVYCYFNKDTVKGVLTFKNAVFLNSSYEFSGQFGRTMARLGDINIDGYNDLAVSAPYEDRGVVYIFLGGPDSFQFYQRITLSEFHIPGISNPLFGEGLSRGYDSDENKQIDFAVGAPNADAVFIYKSYALVKIYSEVTANKPSISYNDGKFSIKVCSYFTSNKVMTSIKILRNITLERRVKISENGTIKFNSTVVKTFRDSVNKESCSNHTIYIDSKKSNSQDKKAIKITVENVPFNKIKENSTEFCKNCVLMEPSHPHKKDFEILYNTVCKEDICKTDLVVKAKFVNQGSNFTIGAKDKITMEFEVLNKGEDAFNPIINLNIASNNARFILSHECRGISKHAIECKLTEGYPLEPNKTVTKKIEIDSRFLSGQKLEILASVSSSGSDTNSTDNNVTVALTLQEFSNIDIVGNSTKVQTKDDKSQIYSLNFEWEIRNSGPSSIDKLIIDVFVPIKMEHKFVDICKDIIISREYGNSYEEAGEEEVHTRNRRFINDINYFSSQDKKPEAMENVTVASVISNVNPNKLIYMNCSKCLQKCMQKKLTVENFVKGDELIIVKLKLEIDVEKLEKFKKKEQGVLLFQPHIVVSRSTANSLDTLKITAKHPTAIIFLTEPFPWLYVSIAACVGLLILLLIIYCLKRKGFFKREKKEIIQEYKRKTALMEGAELEEYTKNVMKIEEAKKQGIPLTEILKNL